MRFKFFSNHAASLPAHNLIFCLLFQNEAASLRAELGALRSAADDAEKAKEGLRSDNTRLTHRISYLEEQVAELLSRHTQVNIEIIMLLFFLKIIFQFSIGTGDMNTYSFVLTPSFPAPFSKQ